MEKATARRLFDLLQDLGHESTPYSRVKTLRENELHVLGLSLDKYPSLGACLISDRTRELWFAILDFSKYNLITTQAKFNLSSRSGIGGVRSAT